MNVEEMRDQALKEQAIKGDKMMIGTFRKHVGVIRSVMQ